LLYGEGATVKEEILSIYEYAPILEIRLIIMKVGIILPTTSHKRDWKYPRNSYFLPMLATFVETMSHNHTYIFYVGYDSDDPFYIRKDVQDFFKRVFSEIQWIPLDFPKGHVTLMWNELATTAYNDGCDYIYQCGDDIKFLKTGWVDASIKMLAANGNIGIVGPQNDGNVNILTQVMTHRTHMDIFEGKFFPPEIKNWYCDDWINEVYPRLRLPPEYRCCNTGGDPRYEIVEMRKECSELVRKGRERVRMYIQQRNSVVNNSTPVSSV